MLCYLRLNLFVFCSAFASAGASGIASGMHSVYTIVERLALASFATSMQAPSSIRRCPSASGCSAVHPFLNVRPSASV